jgi:hypothetical protein
MEGKPDGGRTTPEPALLTQLGRRMCIAACKTTLIFASGARVILVTIATSAFALNHLVCRLSAVARALWSSSAWQAGAQADDRPSARKAAKTLGLSMPPDLFAIADEVIE